MTEQYRILIVDNCPGQMKAWSQVLAHGGFDVVQAETGARALECAGSMALDCAVVNVSLADIDGAAFVEQLQNLAPGLPCILISSDITVQSALAMVGRRGVVAYEHKPVSPERIAALARDVCAHPGLADLDRANAALGKQILLRKRAEAAVRESHSNFRTLFNNVPVGLYRNTPGDKGEFIMANPAIVAMFGFDSEAEFLALNVSDIYVNPDERRLFSDKLSRTGHLAEDPLKFRKKNGEIFWGAVTANAVRDDSGGIRFFDGIVEDITERVQAEQALRRSEERLNSIINNAPSLIYLKDLDFRYILVNNLFRNYYEQVFANIAHPLDNDLFDDETAVRIRSNDTRVLELGRPLEFEDRIPMAGGVRTYYTVKFPLFDERGAPYALCGMSTDITDIKQTQEELERHKTHLEEIVLERTQEFMRANRELQTEIKERKRMERRLGELSERVISMQEQERARLSRELHDELGQQLTALRLEFDMMKKQVPETAAHGFADAISGMLEKITVELRRICKGLRPTVLDDLGLRSALTALIRDFENHSGLQFDVRMEHIPEHRVPSHVAIHVYRVLQESLNNVVKHARADRVAISLEQRADRLALTVSDNGCAMNDIQNHSSGFGIIGMARRAELCHGRVTIVANQPQGTRVTLDVPLAPYERNSHS